MNPPGGAMPLDRVVFTVGHGTRSADELIAVLQAAGIEQLVDVRRFPGSRRHPHFAREEMERWLPESGIAYAWWGEELGGRRSRQDKGSREAQRTRHPAWRNAAFKSYADHTDTELYRRGIERLEAESESTKLTVMCAETLWWRCHRRLVADTLTLRGTGVVHLIDRASSQPHLLHPAVRLGEDGWPIYDRGETSELSLES
jgi:uncharacterized protein (DUF488 family)